MQGILGTVLNWLGNHFPVIIAYLKREVLSIAPYVRRDDVSPFHQWRHAGPLHSPFHLLEVWKPRCPYISLLSLELLLKCHPSVIPLKPASPSPDIPVFLLYFLSLQHLPQLGLSCICLILLVYCLNPSMKTGHFYFVLDMFLVLGMSQVFRC